MKPSSTDNVNEKILDKIYDVLVRIEKHLLKYGPKKEDGKKITVKYVDGQVRLSGIGAYIGDQISRITNAETRVTVLGHVQRGAQPTHRDRLIASAFGVYAVDLIAQEKFNRVVVWKDRGVQDVNLDNVAGYSKTVSKKDPLINVARGLGIYIGELD